MYYIMSVVFLAILTLTVMSVAGVSMFSTEGILLYVCVNGFHVCKSCEKKK